jgi:hypothetical protein
MRTPRRQGQTKEDKSAKPAARSAGHGFRLKSQISNLKFPLVLPWRLGVLAFVFSPEIRKSPKARLVRKCADKRLKCESNMSSSESVIPPPAPLAALVGWLIPGAGYWLLGQRARAAIIGSVVLFLFAAGVLIGGVRVVDAPTEISPTALLNKPWFIGQVLAGPISVASALWADHVDPLRVSHSRSWEIGTLYTAVAGMLNLLALIDATHRAALAIPAEGEKS